MLTAPWIKRIELQSGEKTSMPLRPDVPFPIARVTEEGGHEFSEQVVFDGTSWFHVRRRARQWLLHGSTMSSGSALYVFMEHPEARHAELEAALPRDASAVEVYADWLEEQGDPFGSALKPAVSRARGPAGLWWLEGFERQGAVRVTLRDGFVREAVVGAVPADDLLSTVHRICHLRACVALERLVIDPRTLSGREWSNVFTWTIWTDCRWPSSLRSLSFGPTMKVKGRPSASVLQTFQAKVARKFPQLIVDA